MNDTKINNDNESLMNIAYKQINLNSTGFKKTEFVKVLSFVKSYIDAPNKVIFLNSPVAVTTITTSDTNNTNTDNNNDENATNTNAPATGGKRKNKSNKKMKKLRKRNESLKNMK